MTRWLARGPLSARWLLVPSGLYLLASAGGWL
jgi:hypothetical protein